MKMFITQEEKQQRFKESAAYKIVDAILNDNGSVARDEIRNALFEKVRPGMEPALEDGGKAIQKAVFDS